ncbi:MAG: nucleoside monophosphate kinase [Alphaproteobacteria bacterium]|nr:MAG: nucleoside monophosphate kinase [Alphaproteobacteria bacterium]
MVVLLMGPPGCGKGTQAKLLVEKHGFSHISTGDLIRAEAYSQSDRARDLRETIDQGNLVSDEIILDLVSEKLSNPQKAYLCDGFPRTLSQVYGLDTVLCNKSMRISAVVHFHIPDDLIIERLSGRLSCVQCKAIYNLLYNPPTNNLICDACGANLLQRSDDEPAAIRKRLTLHHEKSAPILAVYEGRGILHTISGAPSPEAVFGALEKILKNTH